MPSESPEGARAVPRTRLGAALLALVSLALVVRLAGVDYLLPHQPEPDGHIVRQVELLEGALDDPASDLNWGKYPHLLARLTQLLPEEPAAERPAVDLDDHLARSAAPFVRVRRVVAWVSVLAIPALFLLARRFLSPLGSLLAAYWMATSLMHVAFSQQARPHAPAMALILLAVAAAVELRRRSDALSFAAAGLACGAAVACLQSGIATLLPVGAAFLLRERPPGRRTAWLAVLPAAAIAASFAIFWPFLGGSVDEKGAERVDLAAGKIHQAGHVIKFTWFTGGGFERTLHSFWSYEPLALLLGAVAVGLWIRARRRASPARSSAEAARARDFWVVLAFVVPYVLVAAAYKRTYGRLVMPLLPFLYLAAAFAVERACDAAARRGSLSRALRGALVALVVLVPAVGVQRHVAMRLQPDTASVAARWIEDNLDPKLDRIARPRGIGLPLVTAAAERDRNLRLLRTDIPSWLAYQAEHPDVVLAGTPWHLPYLRLGRQRFIESAFEDPAGFLDGLQATHVLFEDYRQRRRDPVLEAIYTEARKSCELIQRFSPYREGVEEGLPMSYQDAPIWRQPHYAWRVLRAERSGPVLEVLRLPR